MAETPLRDHSEPCGHAGAFDGNDWEGGGPEPLWLCDRPLWCPGGREVTIDYEAAGEAAWHVIANEEGLIDEGLEWDDLVASDSQSFWIDVGKDTVNAALGGSDG